MGFSWGSIVNGVSSFVGGLKSLFTSAGTYLNGTVGGAIAGSALQGALAGVAIGAVKSIITKGDVFEGALKGAAYGGLIGGAVESVNQFMLGGDWGNSDSLLKSKTATGSQVVDSLGDDTGGAVTGITVDPGPSIDDLSKGSNYWSRSDKSSFASSKDTGLLSGTWDYLKSKDGQKLAAAGVKGLADAYGAYSTNKSAEEIAAKNREAQSALLNQQYGLQQKAIAANKPATNVPAPQAALMTKNSVSDWWQRHLDRQKAA